MNRGGFHKWDFLLASIALRLLALSPVSLSALSSGLSAEPSPMERLQPPRPAISAGELERLSEISTRLAVLNERLRTELESSKRSSSELEGSLETSTRELAELRSELEESRRSSIELAASAGRSERELIELRGALTKADDSLKSLEASFAAYRAEAESRIRSLSFGRFLLSCAAAAGWVAAILLLVAGLGSR